MLHSRGNPILGDGSFYSADPAPLVAGGTLYILAGRDEAPVGVNEFIMNEWQMFATTDVAAGKWLHYPSILQPAALFRWAAPGHAYAGQIVQAADKRFYLYAPVQQAHTQDEDAFGIGVAVADSPLGPWKDAHPGGPIVSQSVPERNRMQNIDPTVMVDDDGKAYLYWGTFGQLRGVELAADMVTPAGAEVTVHTLRGFFEAPWIFRRRGTYYMIYAGNEAGPASSCTPAVYYACIAYGTASSPLGPWTYRGVILNPVSSTTSHPGAIEFKGRWYLVYHTADARRGGHFRRSVALDELHWDDRVQPARMLKVVPTHRPTPAHAPSRNVAAAAMVSASNEPIPVQYWMAALNDGKVPANPLPPEMWGSWSTHNPPRQWVQYRWSTPVLLNAARVWFWADHPPGAKEGVAPPAAWSLEYWHGNGWLPVAHASGYPTPTAQFVEVTFEPVRTSCLRLVLQAAGGPEHYAAVAIEEWEALGPRAMPPGSAAPKRGTGEPVDACRAVPSSPEKPAPSLPAAAEEGGVGGAFS